MNDQEKQWARNHIIEFGTIQNQIIFASFDEAGQVFNVSLNYDELADELITYAKKLEGEVG